MVQSASNAGDFREENAPDRSMLECDIVSEWREGKHKVIEIQKGPGEDVDVIVVKNAYGERRTLSPRSAEFVGRCKQAVLHAEQAVKDSMHAGGRSKAVKNVEE